MGSKRVVKVTVDEDLKELIPEFLENRRKDLALSEQALNENDFETLRRIGHSMKGVGAGYGFDDITRIGADLETAAVSQGVDPCHTLIDELAAYLENLDIHYE